MLSASPIQVRIETDRQSYRRGDDVRVRLTLRNTGSAPLRFGLGLPVTMVELRVTDDEGELVEPGTPDNPQQWAGSSFETELKPGEELVLRWQDADWFDLNDWGYKLPSSERYTIEGIPLVGGSELRQDDKNVRSNRATITVR